MLCAQKKSKLDQYDSKTLLKAAKAYQYGINHDVDKKRAVKIYMYLARRYDNKGMVELGKLYMKGDGVERNRKSAFKLFEKAAEQNDAEAMCRLGDMYRKGDGIKQNYGMAYALYRKASRRSYASGDYGAGYMLYKGLGVDQDYDEAEKYLLQGSERGNAACDFLLGSYYAHGFKGAPDYEKAKLYYTKAAKRGHGWAVDVAKMSLLDSLKAKSSKASEAWTKMETVFTSLKERIATRSIQEFSPDTIDGTWYCTLFTYDWSGKKILKEEHFTMDLVRQDSCLNVSLKKGDSIVSESCLDKMSCENTWRKSFLTKSDRKKQKWLITKISFDKGDGNSLYARMGSLNTENKEKGKPTLAVLKRVTTAERQGTSLVIRSVLPTPLIGKKIVLNIYSGKISSAQISIYNFAGGKMADCGTYSLVKGINRISFEKTLGKGQYIIVVDDGSEKASKTIFHL